MTPALPAPARGGQTNGLQPQKQVGRSQTGSPLPTPAAAHTKGTRAVVLGGGTRGLSLGQGPWETRNDVMCGEEPPAGAEGP